MAMHMVESGFIAIGPGNHSAYSRGKYFRSVYAEA